MSSFMHAVINDNPTCWVARLNSRHLGAKKVKQSNSLILPENACFVVHSTLKIQCILVLQTKDRFETCFKDCLRTGYET